MTQGGTDGGLTDSDPIEGVVLAAHVRDARGEVHSHRVRTGVDGVAEFAVRRAGAWMIRTPRCQLGPERPNAVQRGYAASLADIRASYCKAAIAAAKREARAEALLAAMAPHREALRAVGLFGWVDIEVFCGLTDATLEILGERGANAFWAARLSDSFRLPLLRPLVEGGLFLFGRMPGSLIRLTPRAYPLVHRECGTVQVEVAHNAARLRIDGLPEPMRRRSIVEAFRGHCHAALAWVERHGDVQVDERGLDRGTCVWLTTWS